MSTDDAARQAEIVARLESLQHEVEVEYLVLFESVDSSGKSFLATNCSPWPNAWPFEGCRDLWRESATLVKGAIFVETLQDGGISTWLLARSQAFKSPSGSLAKLANPVKVWLDGIRNPNSGESVLGCSRLVPGDPLSATPMDLACVADKSRLLASVLREAHEEIDQLEASIGNLRPKRGERLSNDEEHYLKMQAKSLQWAKWNWCEWCIYADVVWHYSSALLPVDLAECRQIARQSWRRRKEADWSKLEMEFDRLASRLQWLNPITNANEYAATYIPIQGEASLPVNPSVSLSDEVLLYLKGLDENGIQVIDVPGRLLDPDVFNVLHADGLVEFFRRSHCHVGGKLRIEDGWQVTNNAAYHDHGLASGMLKSALSDDVESPELRVRIRLTKKGKIEASRVRVRNVLPPLSPVGNKTPNGRGRKPKFVDPDAEEILRTYKRVGNQKATVEALKLQAKNGIPALKRVKLVVDRDRTRRSRQKKRP